MATESKQEPSEKPQNAQQSPELLSVKEVLERLGSITRMLRTMGMFVLMTAAMSLFGVVLGVILTLTNLRDEQSFPGRWLLFAALVISGYGMMALYRWDQLKRRGSLYYEEISDELEWRHRSIRKSQVIIQEIRGGSVLVDTGGGSEKPKNGKPEEHTTPLPRRKKGRRRPNLAVRLQLREFLDACTLPFSGANTASTVYLAWFLFCITAGLVGLAYPFR